MKNVDALHLLSWKQILCCKGFSAEGGLYKLLVVYNRYKVFSMQCCSAA